MWRKEAGTRIRKLGKRTKIKHNCKTKKKVLEKNFK